MSDLTPKQQADAGATATLFASASEGNVQPSIDAGLGVAITGGSQDLFVKMSERAQRIIRTLDAFDRRDVEAAEASGYAYSVTTGVKGATLVRDDLSGAEYWTGGEIEEIRLAPMPAWGTSTIDLNPALPIASPSYADTINRTRRSNAKKGETVKEIKQPRPPSENEMRKMQKTFTARPSEHVEAWRHAVDRYNAGYRPTWGQGEAEDEGGWSEATRKAFGDLKRAEERAEKYAPDMVAKRLAFWRTRGELGRQVCVQIEQSTSTVKEELAAATRRFETLKEQDETSHGH